jgi:methyl-accepting chemotaxis protein
MHKSYKKSLKKKSLKKKHKNTKKRALAKKQRGGAGSAGMQMNNFSASASASANNIQMSDLVFETKEANIKLDTEFKNLNDKLFILRTELFNKKQNNSNSSKISKEIVKIISRIKEILFIYEHPAKNYNSTSNSNSNNIN